MFEAGRTNLLASCSKTVWPVSSEAIFTAKNPGASAGCRQISSIRERSSASVAGGLLAGTIDRDVAGTPGDCAFTGTNASGSTSVSRQTWITAHKEFLI